MKKPSSKEMVAEFLLQNLGKIVESRDVQVAAGGAVQYSRRLRDLRADGWKILSHNDTTELKPGQYMLAEKPPEKKPVTFASGISQKLRAEVLERNGFTCQMCGVTPGDIDAVTGRKVRMHIGHIKDKSLGGKEELSNLRTLCSSCNQGAKNVTQEKPTTIWLLAQVRRAGQDEQRAVLKWLKEKFEKGK